MNKIAWLIARRSLFASAYQKSISTMTLISFLGIFIGSFSLALITAIMYGFEVTIHEKMQGIHAQAIIRAYGEPLNMEALGPVLQNEFPEIAAFSPNTTRHALVQAAEAEYAPIVAIIKGIDPIQEPRVSILHKKIISVATKSENFSVLLDQDRVIIGKKLAEELNVTTNDTIELLFSGEEQPQRRKITFDTTDATVGAIFETGIDEFDSSLIFSSLDFLQSLFPDTGIEQVNIKLIPSANEETVVQQLRKRLNLEVYSWKNLYPALVSALKLEKYVTFFILALITLVASMNIISLLFMQITQKRSDIAILKALGMNDNTISLIFILIGMTISFFASASGLLFAWASSWFLARYPFIELPDVYYVSHLPVRMELQILITVFIVVMILTFFATWFPAKKTRHINIAQVLRFEG